MLPLTARNVLLAAMLNREYSLWELPDNPLDASSWLPVLHVKRWLQGDPWSNPYLPKPWLAPEVQFPTRWYTPYRYREHFVPDGDPYEFGKDVFLGAPSPWGKSEPVISANEIISTASLLGLL